MSGHRQVKDQILTFLCNLTRCKSTTEKGRVNPGSHKVQFSILFEWKGVFLNQFNLRILKRPFYFCAMPSNAQNNGLKNDVINWYDFWVICLPKRDISTSNLACQMSRHSSTTCCLFFLEILEFLDFDKVTKNSFLGFWAKHHFSFKCEIAIVRNSLFYVFWCFYLHFAQDHYFWWFFKHLSIFDQNDFTLGHLHQYNSTCFRGKVPKLCINT